MSKDGDLSPADDPRHSGIQVIARSAAIMRALGAHPTGLSLAAIAREVDLPRSTVQRIVCALESEFLVEPIGPGGGFRLGPAVGKLLYQTQTDIISVVRPYLVRLVADLEETAFLARLIGDGVTVIDRVIAEQVLRVVFPVGNTHPLHTTSAGKAVLSALPAADVPTLLPAVLQPRTPRSITDHTALLVHIATARQAGFAADMDEHTPGVSSHSVPLVTYMGVFALGLVVPTARISGQEAALTTALKQAREEIQRRIGAGVKDAAGEAWSRRGP